jgi:hypothetical protein
MALTLAAGVLLAGVILPRQRQMVGLVDSVADGRGLAPAGLGSQAPAGVLSAPLADAAARARTMRQLAMASGVFNLLWATVVVLMILRPGSTTGV